MWSAWKTYASDMKESPTNRPRELPNQVPRKASDQVPRYYQSARSISLIVVHCTATKPSYDYTKERLRRDHVEGRGWSDIGYHIYVRRNGDIEMCRPLAIPGAHAKGYNAHSIGIAWEGGLNQLGNTEDNRTAEQAVSLWHVIEDLLIAYPEARLVGHHDLNPHKACPCMDAANEYKWLVEKYSKR